MPSCVPVPARGRLAWGGTRGRSAFVTTDHRCKPGLTARLLGPAPGREGPVYTEVRAAMAKGRSRRSRSTAAPHGAAGLKPSWPARERLDGLAQEIRRDDLVPEGSLVLRWIEFVAGAKRDETHRVGAPETTRCSRFSPRKVGSNWSDVNKAHVENWGRSGTDGSCWDVSRLSRSKWLTEAGARSDAECCGLDLPEDLALAFSAHLGAKTTGRLPPSARR